MSNSKYLPGGEEHCGLNSRYLQMCLATDTREVTVPRSFLRALVELAQTETDGYTRRTLEPHRQMLLDYASEQMGDQQAAADLAFLVHYLKFDGQLRNALNSDIHDEAMSLLDGFGRMTVEDLREKELTWDWSHVRDSTPEALAECRAFIEGILSFAKEA